MVSGIHFLRVLLGNDFWSQNRFLGRHQCLTLWSGKVSHKLACIPEHLAMEDWVAVTSFRSSSLKETTHQLMMIARRPRLVDGGFAHEACRLMALSYQIQGECMYVFGSAGCKASTIGEFESST
jgi:hypothetical protein